MTDEQHTSDLAPDPMPDSPAQPSALHRTIATIVAVGIILLAVGYLFFHRSSGHPTAASAQAAAPSIASLEETVRVNPTTANRINLSLAYINGNMPSAAIPVLEATLGTEPNNVIALNNLCVAHTMQKEYKAALEACGKATQIDPTFQLAQNNLKWAHDENQKTIQALATMEQTPPAQRNAQFYLNEGLNFLHVGNYDQAIQAWKRALEQDPKSAIAANNIGTAYMYLQQPKDGLQWFQKAEALDPALQVAQNNTRWATAEAAKIK